MLAELLTAVAMFGAPAGGAEPAVVWAVGDGANGTRAAKSLAKAIRRDRPDRFLYLGDVYPSGTRNDFARNYDPVYGPLARRTSAPDLVLIYESGTLDTTPAELPLSIGDGILADSALTVVSVPARHDAGRT